MADTTRPLSAAGAIVESAVGPYRRGVPCTPATLGQAGPGIA